MMPTLDLPYSDCIEPWLIRFDPKLPRLLLEEATFVRLFLITLLLYLLTS